MNKLLLLAALFTFGLSACKKDSINEMVPEPSKQLVKVEKFNQLKTSEQFNWENNQSIDFTVSGMSEVIGVKNTLKVTDPSGEVEYLKVNLGMNENYQTKIILPVQIKQVKVAYGSISKNFTLEEGKVNFNYLVEAGE